MANRLQKETVSAADNAFYKLYLFNLLNTAGLKMDQQKGMIPERKHFSSYHEGSQKDTRLAKVIDSLKPEQVQLLVERIENIL